MSSLRQMAEGVSGVPLGTHDALPGVPLARPTTLEQATELLRLVTRDRLKCAFLGRGSKIGWALLAQAPELAISTEELRGVVEFEPGDGVLTALAGTPLSELEELVRPHGLRLTPAVPRADRGTLGGTIAAGQSGVDRLLHGAMRLHVLGTRVVQLDGHCTRSGGRLVKNVSGYDIHRLLTGSFGSLGLIVEASLRLMTVPEDRRVHCVAGHELGELIQLASRLIESGVRPEALVIDGPHPSWNLQLSLVGRRGHVEAEGGLVAPLLPTAEVLRGEEANQRLEAIRQAEPNWEDGDVLRIALKRSHLKGALQALFLDAPQFSTSRTRVLPGLATIQIQTEDPVTPELLRKLRSTLAPFGGALTLRRAEPLTAPFGPPPRDPARARIAEALRRTYDPAQLLCTRPPLEPLP